MNLENGIYKHYKGNLYEVLGVARHSETEEQHVVYKTLYGDYSMWIRPLEMFVEQIEVEGKQVARFEFVEPAPEPKV
ncbi:MAG: DUF1653 domain-containing protein [Porticoccaceae bacterium]|jgi:hypothetical protein